MVNEIVSMDSSILFNNFIFFVRLLFKTVETVRVMFFIFITLYNLPCLLQ